MKKIDLKDDTSKETEIILEIATHVPAEEWEEVFELLMELGRTSFSKGYREGFTQKLFK